MVKVGIPRALLYYQYYPMWKTFFEGLAAEVVISPPTTQATLSSGSSRVVADTCLPVKVFCGHVLALVEKELGRLGVEVRRNLFTSDWTKFSLFLNPLGINEKDRLHKAVMSYLKRDIGRESWESVGEKVLHADDYDGIIHLAPFTCMPEIVAQNIMPSTKENIPVLTILCDEQLGKPGMLTRLEAFVDLLKYRRAKVKV